MRVKLKIADFGTILFLLSFFCLCLSSSAVGGVNGVVLGTVTDPSGAVIPGAKVILRNSHTGLLRQAVTESNGNYEFLDVPVGQGYSVEVEAQGFRKSSLLDIKLLVNQEYRADFQLVVGSTTQNVLVSANGAGQVQTVSTQLGGVIEDQKMVALPLNGRNYLDLMDLQPGVVPETTGTTQGLAISGNQYGGLLSVNGGREDANQFMVNGGSVEENNNNGASVLPTLESIQEFRLLTNSFDAEYGNFSGSVMNAVTKSGTNDFHGTGFEFLRNQGLDARNFFDYNQQNPITGQEIPNSAIGRFQQNQFGGVFGGPILKNRLFFFISYQGTRTAQGTSSGVIDVPSMAERNGDFSDVSEIGYAPLTGVVRGDNNPADGAMPTLLSQELGYPVTSGEPYWYMGCNTTAECVLPNGVIPQSAWSAPAKALLKFIPPPTGTLSNRTPFFSTTSLLTTTTDDKFAPRIDFMNKATGNWTFYYQFDNSNDSNPYESANIEGFTAITPSRVQYAEMSNTRILSSSSVNVFRVAFLRNVIVTEPMGGLGQVTSFGFQGSGLGLIPQDGSDEGVPQISLNQLGVSFGAALANRDVENTSSFEDNFSKIAGNHSLKFGGLFMRSQFNQVEAGYNGVFGFDGTETGNDLADFLLGAPDTFVQGGYDRIQSRVTTAALYGQDRFRLRPNVTLNYGLRWELGQPWYDAKNRLQTFVPGVQSTVFPNSPEGWVFPNDPGVPRTLAPTRYGDFAPRFGIAYAPATTGGLLGKLFGGPGKTSIRAAYGIFYTSFASGWQGYEEGDPPFSNYYVSPTLVYFAEPFKSRLSGANPGQRFPSPPLPPDVSFASFLPISGSPGYERNNVVPYSEDYNFTIQRQIGKSTILSVGYVGTQGHYLFDQVPFNPGSASKCLHIASLYNAAGEPGQGCGPFGENNIYSIDGQTFDGTGPYSVTSGRYFSQGLLDFNTDDTYEATMGNSNYNSVQVAVHKAVGPLQFLAAYTYSKAMDNSSQWLDLVNPFNYRLSESLSTFDMPQNFVISYSYQLPFGRLAHSQSGVLHRALSGWEVAGITHFSTGVPVSLSESGDLSLCGCDVIGTPGVDLPDYNNQPTHSYNPRTSTNFQQFSTAPFSPEQLGQIGTAGRRFFTGPGLNDWDLSVFKDVRITERVTLEFRGEFFNILNHAQFNNPVGDFAASNFGDVTSANAPRIGQVAAKIIF